MSATIYNGPGRIKYTSEEEARLTNLEKTKENYRRNREKILQYKKDQYKLRKQTNNTANINGNKIIVTPNFVLEIIN